MKHVASSTVAIGAWASVGAKGAGRHQVLDGFGGAQGSEFGDSVYRHGLDSTLNSKPEAQNTQLQAGCQPHRRQTLGFLAGHAGPKDTAGM